MKSIGSVWDDHLSPYWTGGLQRIGKRLNYGKSPWELDWDVMIILDACRADLFNEVAPTHGVYSEFASVNQIYSHASASQEWLKKTFTQGPEERVKETYYVTSNGFSGMVQNQGLLGLEEVWRYAIDSDVGITRSEAVTDVALDIYRNTTAQKYIFHYVPPHAPFLHCAGKYNSIATEIGAGDTQNVWKGLEEGKYELSEVWEDYGKNLFNVLDHVETVIENVSGKVAVTADHGNCVGEWGIYGHPPYVPVPAVKKVPWAIAEGKGKRNYEIQGYKQKQDETDSEDVMDHLKNLGYAV